MKCKSCTNRSQNIFCGLSRSHLQELEDAKQEHRYEPGHFLFSEGDTPQGLFCVSSGKVKIYKADAEGNERIVRLASAGDVLGYRSLLAHGPYSATAETLEATEACFIERRVFEHVLATHPATAFQVMMLLAQDLKHAEDQMLAAVHRTVRERLADLLLALNAKYGEPNHSESLLNITLTRYEMANLVGTTQESVIRLISEFRKQGILKTQGRQIRICDLPALIQVANLSE